MTPQKKSLNTTLHKASKAKNDEFYTQISDIEKEVSHYKEQLRGKVVFCNCDDPLESNFWKYFALNFSYLGLKRLVSTHFDPTQPTYKLELTGDMNEDGKINDQDIIKTPLKQNGDFRSPECIEILKEADIVITNPPFSLFREYIAQLMEHNKKFLIIGNKNAVTYKEIFQFIQQNRIGIGYRNINSDMWLILPDHAEVYEKIIDGKKMKHIMACWFTNLDTTKRHEKVKLYKTFSQEEYPKYDYQDFIEVSKVSEIPCDYDGVMAVPKTFLDKYNP